jgi:hypothetical protein
VDLADGPCRACSSHVLRVLARLRFDPWCSQVLVGRSFGWSACAGRTVRGCRADSPWVPGGQSACSPRTVRYSRCVSGGSVSFFRTVRVSGRTVRGKGADSPRYPAGQSARPLRTVRPAWPDSPLGPGSFVPWFDSSLISFVLLRVLQGIVPKT